MIILTAFCNQCVPGSLLGTDAVLEKPPDVNRLLETMTALLAEPAEARVKRRMQSAVAGALPGGAVRRLVW